MQVPVHRWQSWDYSDPVYQIDRHPICKSQSRKLSDLGAVQVGSSNGGQRAVSTFSVPLLYEFTNQVVASCTPLRLQS
jgi:hypothetical protein